MISIAFSLFCFFQLAFSATETQTALIYNLDKTSGAPLFVQTTVVTTSTEGNRNWNSKIVDNDGKLVMTEKAETKNGKMFYQYVEQLQINESYELKVDGTQATFLTYKIKDGEKGKPVESNTVDVSGDFITGPLTESYLQKNWENLTEGKSVWVNFGVFEVSKTVGFQFRQVASTDSTIKLKMKPSNFFISMLVEPIYIEFDKDKKKIIKFRGRTPLRTMVNGKLKALDADIIYK